MEMRSSQLWKLLLTQLTVSGAHRNAQCNGTRTLFSFPEVLIILPLSIITQEIRNFSHSFFQNFNSWQIYYPEMIRLFPVKSTSLYDQDLLILQQIQCKFFIIYNVELLYIDLREHIKCSLRFDGSDSRNVSQCLVNIFALFVNTSARNEVVVDALIAPESGLNDRLCRNIGAETRLLYFR